MTVCDNLAEEFWKKHFRVSGYLEYQSTVSSPCCSLKAAEGTIANKRRQISYLRKCAADFCKATGSARSVTSLQCRRIFGKRTLCTSSRNLKAEDGWGEIFLPRGWLIGERKVGIGEGKRNRLS